MEVKRRIGRVREKVRIAVPYEAAWLNRAPLHHPDLADAPARLRAEGVCLPPLDPLFVVRYERHRFSDPSTGVRINLDRRIHVPTVNPETRCACRQPALPHAVLEVKGRGVDELPRALHPVLLLGCRLGSFSKYSSCYLSILGAAP